VQFGTLAGTLVVEPGAIFHGAIVADSAVADTLLLAAPLPARSSVSAPASPGSPPLPRTHTRTGRSAALSPAPVRSRSESAPRSP
jgi:hypothetical protein